MRLDSDSLGILVRHIFGFIINIESVTLVLFVRFIRLVLIFLFLFYVELIVLNIHIE